MGGALKIEFLGELMVAICCVPPLLNFGRYCSYFMGRDGPCQELLMDLFYTVQCFVEVPCFIAPNFPTKVSYRPLSRLVQLRGSVH